jgi:DNA polymerase IV
VEANLVQWLFLDLNAFFASCEQQEAPALRGKPVIVVQTLTDAACAIAASYAAKAFGIKTGTLVREARRLCPAVIPVQANHRLYTDYHDRILQAVDTCLPIEKVMSIDEVACRLMGTERQVPAARELALKMKRVLREQIGACLTCSIGIAPNVFLGKVGSDLQKPDGLTVITADKLPDILLGLELQEIYGIGARMEQRLNRAGIFTVAQLWQATPFQNRRTYAVGRAACLRSHVTLLLWATQRQFSAAKRDREASLISLTSEEKRTRPHIIRTYGHPTASPGSGHDAASVRS